MEELTKELKEEIIEALNLEEMTPEDIDENDALFGDGLGLDSIDARWNSSSCWIKNMESSWLTLLKVRLFSKVLPRLQTM